MAKLPYKHLYQKTSRHGTVSWYVRLPDRPLIRLPDDETSTAFLAAYHRALTAPPEAPASDDAARPGRKVLPGSFAALCAAYRGSPDFLAYEPSTRQQKTRVMNAMVAEPVARDSARIFGDGPVADFTAPLIELLRDRKAQAPEAANHRLKVLRPLFKWAKKHKWTETDPTIGVESLKTFGQGHHTWTTQEVAQYLESFDQGSKERLALGLLLFLGIRISDLARIGPQQIRGGTITFQPYKGRKRNPKLLQLPIRPELQAIIDQTKIHHLTFMVNEWGSPFSIKGLGQWFKTRCKRAGLPHCSAHGLRKAGATIAAENGATEEDLKALYGWSNAKEANLYTRKARQKIIAERASPYLNFGDRVNDLIKSK
mgnify:CR=1 FL=1|tara:strand:- start:214591 stop:215700 length:1110 start_codon:yes stop_codon:yes gene_type:complete